MNLLDRLDATFEKIKDFRFLLTTAFIFFLLRLPSLFEPYWYGDEGIYQTIGIAVQQGKILYRDIWDNKPPFLYMLYSFFSSDQFTLRLVSLVFGVFSIIVFYKLVRRLFTRDGPVYITTILFALFFGSPFLEGNIANSENFMLLPILLAGFLIYNYSLPFGLAQDEHAKRYTLILAGLLLSFAFLFKIVAIFDFAALFLFLFIHGCKGRTIKLKQSKHLFLFIVSFAVPILITAFYFLMQGAFGDFFSASFMQNVGYVGYGNRLLIPQGFLILKLIILSLVILFLFKRRGVLSIPFLFIMLSFSFGTFNAFFSQRPYTHYMLVLLPSFLLLFGFLLETQNKKEKSFGILAFALVLFFVVTNFRFYAKTPLYYKNFISFLTTGESVEQYRAFFDRNTPKDYAIAQFIDMHAKKEDGIFVWGNNAQLYKLTNKLPPGRYTVAYHAIATPKSIKETEASLKRANPRFIIVNSNDFPFDILSLYKQRITIQNVTIYEKAI